MFEVPTLTQGDRLEEDSVVGGDLAHLPELGGGDGAVADEAARAGGVKHERHRHVACVCSRMLGLLCAS